MKNKIMKLSLFALVLVMLLPGCKKKDDAKKYNSIFDCGKVTEVREHIHTGKFGMETDDAELRLYNLPMLDGAAYCVVQYDPGTDAIIRIDCYMELSAKNIMEQSAKMKAGFLKMINQETGEYEFYPVDENQEVGKSDFLTGDASMEMFIYGDAVTWNMSWLIAGETASLRLSKFVG